MDPECRKPNVLSVKVTCRESMNDDLISLVRFSWQKREDKEPVHKMRDKAP